MFCHIGMRWLHVGQWDGGWTMLSPRGIRWITTLRKLPVIAPKIATKNVQKWKGKPNGPWWR